MLVNALSIVIEKTQLPKRFFMIFNAIYLSQKLIIIKSETEFCTAMHGGLHISTFANVCSSWICETIEVMWKYDISYEGGKQVDSYGYRSLQYINVASLYGPSNYLNIVHQIYTQGYIFFLSCSWKKLNMYIHLISFLQNEMAHIWYPQVNAKSILNVHLFLYANLQ